MKLSVELEMDQQLFFLDILVKQHLDWNSSGSNWKVSFRDFAGSSLWLLLLQC